MTWAEFRIRLHAYKRMQENEIYKLRELAWITYIAPHQNPKKMKKSKEAFWPLKKNKGVDPKIVKRIREEQEKFKQLQNE